MEKETFLTPEAHDFLAEVERIKAQYPATPPIGQTNPEEIERLSGLFPDDALFEAAVRAGQEWRNAENGSPDQLESDKRNTMAQPTLENRVALLEKEVARLRSATDANAPNDPAGQKKGWRWFVGVFANSPEFEEVVRRGEEWRNADRPRHNETEEAEAMTGTGA